MSVPRQMQTNHAPSGELEIIVSPDGENSEKLWVFMEQDPEHPGSQRLRWSNGQVWYPGQVSEEIEVQCGECVPVIVSPSDSSISRNGFQEPLKPQEWLYIKNQKSAKTLLAQMQNRNRE